MVDYESFHKKKLARAQAELSAHIEDKRADLIQDWAEKFFNLYNVQEYGLMPGSNQVNIRAKILHKILYVWCVGKWRAVGRAGNQRPISKQLWMEAERMLRTNAGFYTPEMTFKFHLEGEEE